MSNAYLLSKTVDHLANEISYMKAQINTLTQHVTDLTTGSKRSLTVEDAYEIVNVLDTGEEFVIQNEYELHYQTFTLPSIITEDDQLVINATFIPEDNNAPSMDLYLSKPANYSYADNLLDMEFAFEVTEADTQKKAKLHIKSVPDTELKIYIPANIIDGQELDSTSFKINSISIYKAKDLNPNSVQTIGLIDVINKFNLNAIANQELNI